MQLMTRVKSIFDSVDLKAYLRPYGIVVTSKTAGFIEFLTDTISLDSLKKKFITAGQASGTWTLRRYFEVQFRDNFEEAQKNFVESLAGYSLFNYVFNVKDRHNGNILLTSEGHLVHIDFGFML
jgi:phosphatidylinositol 4-kinase